MGHAAAAAQVELAGAVTLQQQQQQQLLAAYRQPRSLQEAAAQQQAAVTYDWPLLLRQQEPQHSEGERGALHLSAVLPVEFRQIQ